MKYVYTPQGVCSTQMLIDMDDKTHIINDIKIVGGCAGNTLGISKLVKGMRAEDVIASLKGTPCGFRITSCPDQLSKALEEMLEKINEK